MSRRFEAFLPNRMPWKWNCRFKPLAWLSNSPSRLWGNVNYHSLHKGDHIIYFMVINWWYSSSLVLLINWKNHTFLWKKRLHVQHSSSAGSKSERLSDILFEILCSCTEPTSHTSQRSVINTSWHVEEGDNDVSTQNCSIDGPLQDKR